MGKRFRRQARIWKGRRTLCTSRFQIRSMAAKDPPTAADNLLEVPALKLLILQAGDAGQLQAFQEL